MRETGKLFLTHLSNLCAAGAFYISGWLLVWGHMAEAPPESGAGESVQAALVLW